jgi:hypothetical protein
MNTNPAGQNPDEDPAERARTEVGSIVYTVSAIYSNAQSAAKGLADDAAVGVWRAAAGQMHYACQRVLFRLEVDRPFDEAIVAAVTHAARGPNGVRGAADENILAWLGENYADQEITWPQVEDRLGALVAAGLLYTRTLAGAEVGAGQQRWWKAGH